MRSVTNWDRLGNWRGDQARGGCSGGAMEIDWAITSASSGWPPRAGHPAGERSDSIESRIEWINIRGAGYWRALIHRVIMRSLMFVAGQRVPVDRLAVEFLINFGVDFGRHYAVDAHPRLHQHQPAADEQTDRRSDWRQEELYHTPRVIGTSHFELVGKR